MEEFRKEDKSDSVRVSKTASGKYTADVKVYSKDLLEEHNQDAVVQAIADIYVKLGTKFNLK